MEWCRFGLGRVGHSRLEYPFPFGGVAFPSSRSWNGYGQSSVAPRSPTTPSYGRLRGLRWAGIFVLFVIEAKYIQNTANEIHTVALWISCRARLFTSALYVRIECLRIAIHCRAGGEFLDRLQMTKLAITVHWNGGTGRPVVKYFKVESIQDVGQERCL
jgi:hypothetical protein